MPEGQIQIRRDTIVSGPHTLHRIGVEPRDGNPIARLAVLHGYGDHAGRFVHFMQWMATHGVACHAIDFRGHGHSTGKRGHVDRWDEYLDDLTTFIATEELATNIDQPPLFVLGHSHGGLIAAAAAIRGQLHESSKLATGCRGVILSSPYLDLKMPVPWHKRLLGTVGSTLFPALQVRSGVGDQPLSRDPAMVADTKADPHALGIATPRWFKTATEAQADVRSRASEFTLPLLMLIAGADTIANPAASMAFYEQCGSSDKSVKVYDDFRHEILRDIGRERVFNDILDWVRLK